MRIARGISVTNTSRPVGISYDADATAFFTAASITNTTQKSAVNTLVIDLKAANIWTKMKALYPVVGGSASSHAVNLKQPGTFNLSFSTGWTHSITGMTPNGAAFSTTNMNTSVNLTSNNAHVSYYITTEPSSNAQVVIGNVDNTGSYLPIIQLYPKTSGNLLADMQDYNYRISGANTNSLGLYVLNRSASNNYKVFKNNSVFGTNTGTQPQSSFPNSNLYLGAFNNAGTPGSYSTCTCVFSSSGNSLTDSEALSFYNAVQAYQTTLGRQV